MRPVPEMYPVTQRYRDDYTQYNVGIHGAVDVGTPVGTPVLAPEDGEIIHADWVWALPGGPHDWESRDFQIKPEPGNTWTGGGIMVGLRNAVGSRWWIAHLSRTDMNPGDRVVKGQVIGYTGNTGSSTGPHAHIALVPPNPDRYNTAFGAIDPLPYFTEKYEPRRYLAWQGGPTTGSGSTVIEGDEIDMASMDDLRRVVAEETRQAVIRELTYPRDKQGPHAGGKVSLQDEILHLASNFAVIARAVSPAAVKASVAQAVAEVGLDLDQDALAERVADHLFAKAVASASATTTTEGA